MSLRCAAQYALCRCGGGYEKELRSIASLLYCVSEALYNLASLVLIMRSRRIHHPAAKMALKTVLYLYFFAPPPTPVSILLSYF